MLENIRTSQSAQSALSVKTERLNVPQLALEAQRLYTLAMTRALTLGSVISVLKRIQADAYAAGLRQAATPVRALSDDIDRRMAALALSTQGDSDDSLDAH